MNLAAWLRLTLIPGAGGETQRKLLAAFGLPENIFAAGRSGAAAVVGQNAADRIFDTDNTREVEAALAWAGNERCHIVTLADPEYPAALLEIPDPPTLLYVRGRLDPLRLPALAIVGSRNATPQGRQTAIDFARTLSDAGYCIVSGLALGIDAAAHEGALPGRGGTLAVIGTGADRIYPARNKDLATAIVHSGAIISEFPLGTPALAANFPRRNRIISGLVRGVLVVEAAIRSGSLITARLAGEQGREVFAIPGSIHSPVARGCHRLIKQGAKLVETASDILEELGTLSPAPVSPPDDEKAPDDPLLAAIGYAPVSLDELLARTGLSTDRLLTALMELELGGQLASLPGGLYQRLRSS